MFSIEKLCKAIANKIALELNLDNDKREVIAYGAFAILHMLLSIILVIIFGALFNVLVEALIISLTISILRKYSGGVHASTPGICAAIGTIVCIGLALGAVIVSSMASLNLLLILGCIVFIWSYHIIYKFAPVDSLAKPIKKTEKRKRMKKGSIFILSFYLIIEIINIVVYVVTGNKNFIVYLICIYLGVIWQVFTLTASGSYVVGKIDSFLNHIQSFIGRRIQNERIN